LNSRSRIAAGGATASRTGGITLFVLVFVCVFVVPLLPLGWHRLVYNGLYTAIFIIGALSLEQHRNRLLGLAVVAAVLEWVSYQLHLVALTAISRMLNGMFFLIIVIYLILQIARTKEVDARVILAAVNGYLLLGLAASMAVTLIALSAPEAFSFPQANPLGESALPFSNYVYYGFVTLTTVGYGDVVPRAPHAKSLAILIGVTGQLYVAIIIAMLVGKLVSTKKS